MKAKQYILDFTSRQVERRSMLHAAVVEIQRARHRVTPLHWSLCQWILNLDDECLRKSHQEIADTLFATVSTLRRVIADLEGWGVIAVAEQVYATSGQGPNEYRLAWDGVRTWHARLLARQGMRVAPPAQSGHPPAQTEQPPAQTEHAYKEYTSSCIPSKFLPPPPTSPPASQKSEGGEMQCSIEEAVPAADRVPAWRTIESKLRTLGLREVGATITSAQHAGMPPETLDEAIAFYEANRGAWGVGAICFAVSRWHAGVALDDAASWPSPHEAWRKRAFGEAQQIVQQGRARGAPDRAIRAALTNHGCLLFAGQLLARSDPSTAAMPQKEAVHV